MKKHPVQTIPTYEGGPARKIAPENKEVNKKTLEDLQVARLYQIEPATASRRRGSAES